MIQFTKKELKKNKNWKVIFKMEWIFQISILIDVVNTLGNNEFDKKIDVDESKEQIQEDSTQNTESYSFAGT